MSPVAQSDGHDGPGLLDEDIPGETAVIEDVLVGRHTRLESQLSRMYCQMFSSGFSSGDFGGNGSRVMLLWIGSLAEVCQPAWSSWSMSAVM